MCQKCTSENKNISSTSSLFFKGSGNYFYFWWIIACFNNLLIKWSLRWLPFKVKQSQESDTCCLFFAAGECYLMEWSDWSSCVNICAKEAGVDFASVQVRSRAVLAQEPENLLLCPDQEWESQPCTGGEHFEKHDGFNLSWPESLTN